MRTVGALLLIAAIALPTAGTAQQQRLYKWTDESGGVHYSNNPPPVETQDITPLEPYRSTREIDDLGDHRAELLESQIKLTETYLDNLRKKLVDLQAEASNYKP